MDVNKSLWINLITIVWLFASCNGSKDLFVYFQEPNIIGYNNTDTFNIIIPGFLDLVKFKCTDNECYLIDTRNLSPMFDIDKLKLDIREGEMYLFYMDKEFMGSTVVFDDWDYINLKILNDYSVVREDIIKKSNSAEIKGFVHILLNGAGSKYSGLQAHTNLYAIQIIGMDNETLMKDTLIYLPRFISEIVYK